jgi:hypothetical protein
MRLTTVFIIFGFILATTHFLALNLFLYDVLWWFDILTHFLGGLVVVLAWGAFVDMGWLKERFNQFKLAFLWLFSVMIAWEVFELLARTTRDDNFVLDTTIDLVMGAVGGLVAWLISERFLKRKESTT